MVLLPAISATVPVFPFISVMILSAVITGCATMRQGAPSVDRAAMPVATHDHADLVDGAATGVTMMGDPPR